MAYLSRISKENQFILPLGFCLNMNISLCNSNRSESKSWTTMGQS